MNDIKFTYSWYADLIEIIYENNYTITNYHEYSNHKKPCILRHDVDMDIIKASEFAEKESKYFSNSGFKGSTYFVLLSSDFYNIFSKNSLIAADKILSLGNEMGLHFDETKYQINNDAKIFEEFVEEELYLLGKALGIIVNIVSMHRPSKSTLDNNLQFKNAVNSYSHEFFKDFKYVSDSRMNWREDIKSIISSHDYNKLHILTHPFWYSDELEDTKTKIMKYIQKAKVDRYISFSSNFKEIEEFLKLEDVL